MTGIKVECPHLFIFPNCLFGLPPFSQPFFFFTDLNKISVFLKNYSLLLQTNGFRERRYKIYENTFSRIDFEIVF